MKPAADAMLGLLEGGIKTASALLAFPVAAGEQNPYKLHGLFRLANDSSMRRQLAQSNRDSPGQESSSRCHVLSP